MRRTIGRALIAISLWTSAGYAGIRWANSAGNAYRRTDFADIHFKLNSSTAESVLPDGDAVAAVQAALTSWNNVPNTAIHFAPLETTSSGINSADNQNVIALADSPGARSVVGAALAVTNTLSFSDGRIVETDIIINPDVRFSVALVPGTFDLQSVLTHELGHSLGANHAVVLSSTMFSSTGGANNNQALIKADDAAFAVEVYPGPGAAAAYGSVTGAALKDGASLAGAAVIATDRDTGLSIGGMSSLSDGSFSLRVPAGNYLVFVQPLTGLFAPNTFYNVPGLANPAGFLTPDKVDVNFKTAVSGGLDNPIAVAAGISATVNVAAAGGASAISIFAVGTAAGGGFFLGPRPVVVPSGQPLDFLVSGPGLDSSITAQDIKLIGPGAAVRPGTLRVDSQIQDAQGRSPLRFTIDVAPVAARASVSVFITHDSGAALLPGAITVLPVKPVFAAGSVVDAASFKGSGVAPGELVSLFGTGLGPVAGVGNSGFDPATGALPVALAGIGVTFDGIAAPLIFASSGQINLQVPYEIAGRVSTVVVVRNNGTSSDPVTVPVLPAQPGMFTQPGSTQAIAVNQDGSLNSTASPASRGSLIVIYATGSGLVDPPVSTGKPAPSAPLAVANGVAVRIGGVAARVIFGGLTPGFVGLMQVNVEVPAGSASGSVPVELIIAGQTSPATTTLALKP